MKYVKGISFSVILSSILLLNTWQGISAARDTDTVTSSSGMSITSSDKKVGTLKRSTFINFNEIELDKESVKPDLSGKNKCKTIPSSPDSYEKSIIFDKVLDYKNKLYFLGNLWLKYKIFRVSHNLINVRHIDFLGIEDCSKIENILDRNESMYDYISGIACYKPIEFSNIFNNVSKYLSMLLSWFEYLNHVGIISKESLIEIKTSSLE